MSILDIDVSERETRIPTGLAPLDDVLGGGIVVGSLVLLAGDPGAGKSTLLMQMIGLATCAGPRLYATGEESVAQVAMRARRVHATNPDIKIVRETDLESILWHASDLRAKLLVVDSAHTISSHESSGLPGSDHQVKTCGQILMKFAKDTNTSTIVISHVNKDGGLSGPVNFEHAGDATLMIEKHALGDPWRVLRAQKNRFGDTSRTGILAMRDTGLVPASSQDVADLSGDGEGGGGDRDSLAPIAQELLHLYQEIGGQVDRGLRDRIAGRLDLTPRGSR